MKIAKTVLLLLLAAFLLAVCLTGNYADRPIGDIEQTLLQAPGIATLKRGTENDLRRFYGIEEAAYDGCFVYLPQNPMDVDEVLVVKLKDTSQKAGLEKLILARQESQKSSFEGYGVEQTALLNQYVLQFKGKYAFYGVSSQVQAWQEAFTRAIQG